MTPRERAIVETYTGFCMATGEQRNEVYKYMNEIMARPVYTHELALKEVQEELKAKSKGDFINLCRMPQTQADKIRSMSDEELAEILFGSCFDEMGKEGCEGGNCKVCVLEWLKSEAKE